MNENFKINKSECNFLDISRFIGIYLVVFAHFMFSYEYSFLSYWAFSFHMPLFFIISGILHQNSSFSKSNLSDLAYSLIVPYLIYNFLGFLYLLLFSNTGWERILPRIVATLLGENPITGASWFLLALFWVKLWSLFLRSRRYMVIFSLCCILGIVCFDYFAINFDKDNLFMLRTALASFPFFTLGYLIKQEITRDIKIIFKMALMLLFVAGNIILFRFFGSFSLAEMAYKNLFMMYLMATFGSLALIYFSQLVVPLVKCNFIRDISRGTMIIVGLHFFVIYDVFNNYLFGVTPIRLILLWSVCILLGFYIIIKLTYNTFPILYGKRKK